MALMGFGALVNLGDPCILLFKKRARLDWGSPEFNNRIRSSLLNSMRKQITTFERQDGADKNCRKSNLEKIESSLLEQLPVEIT